MTPAGSGGGHPRRRRRRAYAEFLQIWEEGYVSNHVSFEVMHLPSTLILEGEPLKREDGELDRGSILSYVEAVIASNPQFRLRLQRSALGLTPPAWVPDERFALSRHVLFSDEVVDIRTADLRRLGGADDGLMPIDHPLWRLRVTRLTDGRVALGSMTHHVTNDGLGAMKTMSHMCQKTPDQPLPQPHDPFAGQRAARRVELPWLAVRGWWRRHATLGAAWEDYRARPFVRRLRRVAARILLPIRYRSGGDAARRAALPPRHSSFRVMEAAAASRYARERGGTVSDLLLAAMMRAWDGPDAEIKARFPISYRSAERTDIRNHVRDIEIHARTDLELPALMKTVREQIDDRDAQPAGWDAPGTPIGYATILPWVSTPRYFAGARVMGLTAPPASLGTDKLAAAGVLYDGRLFVGATMPADLDVEQTIGRMYELMTGHTDPGRP